MITVPVTCAHRLTAYEPVIEGLIRVDWGHNGWELTMRHRHVGGLFADCSTFEVSHLTTGEMLDVICAVADEWGPFGGPPVHEHGLSHDR